MKKLVILLATCLAGMSASAQTTNNPVYEPFSDSTSSGGTSYAPGDYLSGQSQTVSGFETNYQYVGYDGVQSWWEYGPSIYSNGVTATHQPMIVSGDLSYLGLSSAAGGRSVQFGGDGDDALMNLPTGNGAVGFLLGYTVYVSFVLKMTDLTVLDTNGAFYAGFTQIQSYDHPYGTPNAIGARLWVRSDGSGGLFNLGIQKGGKGPDYGPIQWDSRSFTTTDTLFLVASYTLQGIAGNSGGIDDVAHLWINPDYSAFGTNPAPAADVTASETNNDTSDLDLQRIASYIIVDYATNEPAGQLDDLRIGLEWADVTPPATNVVQLVSAQAVAGPYTSPSGQFVDVTNKVITVPMSGARQFYRIESDSAVTITGISISNGNVVINYN